jgi:thiaminase
MGAATKHAAVQSAETSRAQPLQPSPLHSFVETAVGEGPPASFGLATLELWPRGEVSAAASRISMFSESDKRCVGTLLVTPAEASTIAAGWGAPREALERCVVVSDVALDLEAGDVLPALIYMALRRGRIWDRAMVVAAAPRDGSNDPTLSTRRFDLEPLPSFPDFEASGRTYRPVAQRLDLAICRAWKAAPDLLVPALHAQFVPETVETLDRWIERFFKTPWFKSILEGTMSKQQYIYTLSNQHQFVRWTTRLIGLAVRHSKDLPMRNKWLEHLQEEINHELLIEKDLAALGADVEYVTSYMAPNVATQQFMVAQESMIGFHSDPVLFMAAPFAAEGFASRLDQKFIAATRTLVKSWGVENPKHATTFFASHIEYDGGQDGHWEHSHRILGSYLRTDYDLQRFLNVLRLAMYAFDRSYTSFVEDLAMFAATPGPK